MKALSEYFSQVSDPRSYRNQHHPFMSLIGTTLCAGLAGIDSFSGIADYVEAHFEGLSEYFEFPFGPPSHDTYQRLWEGIRPCEFSSAFFSFTHDLAEVVEGILSLDGKTIRNSGKEGALHIVSAWCEANQMVLAQEKVDDKSNEITAVPRLLNLLDLRNRIVTYDAMGAQRNICQQILDQEGDYVISLKGNQRSLFEDVKNYWEDLVHQQKAFIFKAYDKGHGRIEERIAYTTQDIGWLQEDHHWPGLHSIGMVKSTVERNNKLSEETRYYISSLPANAELLYKAARSHWAIENKLHWRLDVVFNEDKACIQNENAAENMGIIRKWTLNALQKAKTKPEQTIKSLMRKNAMSFKHTLNCINKIFHA